MSHLRFHKLGVCETGSSPPGPEQGFTVPKGVMHKTRAPEQCVILMVEGGGVIPTGD